MLSCQKKVYGFLKTNQMAINEDYIINILPWNLFHRLTAKFYQKAMHSPKFDVT